MIVRPLECFRCEVSIYLGILSPLIARLTDCGLGAFERVQSNGNTPNLSCTYTGIARRGFP